MKPTTFLQRKLAQHEKEHVRLLRLTNEAKRASCDGKGTVQTFEVYLQKLGKSKIALERLRKSVNDEFRNM
jgi:hypothetical protein